MRCRIASDSDQISDQLGFRTIAVEGTQIFLNGEPIRFRGISTHEEPIGRDGVAYSRADIDALFGEAKQLGVNFVRAAHYPYSRHAAKAADEMGLLLWEEVPIYWNINWENPETLRIARDQVARLVQRDWNRASVVVWSVANETTYSEPRMAFLNRLIQDVRELDDTRLVSAALLGDTRARIATSLSLIWRPMDSLRIYPLKGKSRFFSRSSTPPETTLRSETVVSIC